MGAAFRLIDDAPFVHEVAGGEARGSVRVDPGAGVNISLAILATGEGDSCWEVRDAVAEQVELQIFIGMPHDDVVIG